MKIENTLKKMENACFSIASSLDGNTLSGDEYNQLLGDIVYREFSGKNAAYIAHPVHWALVDCGMEYRAAMSMNSEDASEISVPGPKISRQAISQALRKYSGTIIARLR